MHSLLALLLPALSTALRCPSTPDNPSASWSAGRAGVSSPAPTGLPGNGAAVLLDVAVVSQPTISGTHSGIAVCVCVRVGVCV